MSPTGHLAVGFAAKRYAPKMPLAALLIAAYAIDLIYFAFLALGMDTKGYNPWSHSLLMAVIWSVAGGLITLFLRRERRCGLVMGLVVLSHWLLDFVVWGNLPVSFDRTTVIGLGLYDKIGFSLTGLKIDSGSMLAASIELGMLIVGLATYVQYSRRTRSHASS